MCRYLYTAHGSAVSPDGKLMIFAGYDGNVRLNDMWEIDLKSSSPATASWREVAFTGEAPPAWVPTDWGSGYPPGR